MKKYILVMVLSCTAVSGLVQAAGFKEGSKYRSMNAARFFEVFSDPKFKEKYRRLLVEAAREKHPESFVVSGRKKSVGFFKAKDNAGPLVNAQDQLSNADRSGIVFEIIRDIEVPEEGIGGGQSYTVVKKFLEDAMKLGSIEAVSIEFRSVLEGIDGFDNSQGYLGNLFAKESQALSYTSFEFDSKDIAPEVTNGLAKALELLAKCGFISLKSGFVFVR